MATKAKKQQPAPKQKPEPKQRERKRSIPLKSENGNWKLVLTEDVEFLGKQGDLVDVRAGFARNYLLPRGLATIPTKDNIRLLGKYKIKVRQAREAKIADLKSLAVQISKLPGVAIEAKTTAEGHLYGSVGPAEIVEGLKAEKIIIEQDMVRMDGKITEVGIYEVTLNLGYDIETKLKVGVAEAGEG